MVSVDIFPILTSNKIVFASFENELFDFVKEKIIAKYDSLAKYANSVGIERNAFSWAFKKRYGFQLCKIVEICNNLEMDREFLYSKITGFYSYGSRNVPVKIKRFIDINSLFVEGYGLYVAEGDTGFSGKKKSRKFRFTNSSPSVINFFTSWLDEFFSGVNYYLLSIRPRSISFKDNSLDVNLKNKRMKITSDSYNLKMKYRVCMDNAMIIDLFLNLQKVVRDSCLKDKELAASYLRGLMAGEGTVYGNRSKYVRIEMKNSSEIEFVRKLLDLLEIKHTYHTRKNRIGMESLYIGGRDNIKRYYDLVGFGCQDERQEKLRLMVEKFAQPI